MLVPPKASVAGPDDSLERDDYASKVRAFRGTSSMRNRIEQGEPKKSPELRHAILSEDGEVVPCDLMTWAYWLEANHDRRIVARDDLPYGYFISTVFLGLNHSFFKAPPLWFETMVFEPSDGIPSPITGKIHKLGNEAFSDRYSTLEEAREGHEIIKAKWLGHFSQMAKKEEDARNRNPVRDVRRPSQSEPEAD